jgi:glucan endo-1,3-beta-D-glucosidase
MRSAQILALAASLSTTSAVYQGFNYGATKSDGYTVRVKSDWDQLFSTAKNLAGTNSKFTSARLYTNIQGGSANSPIEAIPAAIDSGTTLLLGIWTSGGSQTVDNEVAAIKAAISQYGTKYTDLVAGISIGSEDLYRDSDTGRKANAGVGVGPDVIVSYIKQIRQALSGTTLSKAPIGHVDTWTAWVNGTNAEVIANVDWVGFDAYPYFQNTQSNGVENGAALFNEALTNTKNAAGSKPVWITETGWPVSGATQNLAVPSVSNAKIYWDAVACPLLGVTNTWWFTLEDNDAGTTDPQFGVTDKFSTTPYYDLSCTNRTVSSSTSSSASSTATSSGSSSASGSATASGSASGSASTSSAVVSSGSGLSPTQGNGVGSASITTTASVASGTGASGNGSTPVTSSSGSGSGSGSSSSASGTHTVSGPSGTNSSPATVSGSAAIALSASSFVGVVGAMIAAVAAL